MERVMGVVIGAREFDLDLPGYPDVKIRTKGLTVGEALDFGMFLDGVPIAAVMTQEQLDRRDEAYALLASRVTEWNLEVESGIPLPMDLAGMSALDWRMARDIFQAWVTGVSGVSVPLERLSPSGPPSPVESVPMEPWLENHGS